MAVPYTFATATGSIPLSQLDTNFATGIIIGNTTVTLGDTITTINNLTLANVTVTSASFSNVTLTGNTTLSGTGTRILGNFTQSAVVDRPLFQTTVTNGSTSVGVVTNGTGTNTNFVAWNNSTGTSASYIAIQADSTRMALESGVSPGGTNLPLAFLVAGAEVARFTTSGNYLVGTTTSTIAGNGGFVSIKNNSTGQYCIATDTPNQSGTYYHIAFGSAGTYTGSIQGNGSSTSYLTSSDYRLKENVQPMTGALAKVLALNPVTYTWKSTGVPSQGFIAHELQAIIPDAVMGDKDAVDENGNPKYQGVDTSFVVATLTAAIKELTARVAALESA